MKSFNVEVLFADNGGIALHVPQSPAVKTSTRHGKLYVSKDMSAQAIGELFLALHVDVKLDTAAGIDLENIEF
jgi:hypothetical protein